MGIGVGGGFGKAFRMVNGFAGKFVLSFSSFLVLKFLETRGLIKIKWHGTFDLLLLLYAQKN